MLKAMLLPVNMLDINEKTIKFNGWLHQMRESMLVPGELQL